MPAEPESGPNAGEPAPPIGGPDGGGPDSGGPDSGGPDSGGPDRGRPSADESASGGPDSGRPGTDGPVSGGANDAGSAMVGGPAPGEVSCGYRKAGSGPRRPPKRTSVASSGYAVRAGPDGGIR
jgi:hypothetical protein